MPMLTYQQVRSEATVDEAEQRTTSPENKRLMADRGEHDLSTTEKTKRRKLAETNQPELIVTNTSAKKNESKETIDGHYSASSDKKKVDPTELASAFALASLASLSPGGRSVESDSTPRESREATTERKDKNSKNDDEVRKAASFESETRSPKASEHPVSPDPRSLRDQDMASSPGSRRVSFAPNTKESDTNAPSTPISSNKESSRLLAMPQQSPRSNSMMVSPRPHRMYGGRGLPPFVRTPPPSHQMYGTPPPLPHAPYHNPAAQRVVPRGFFPVGSFRHGPPPHFVHRPVPPQFGYAMGSPAPRFQPGMPPRQLMQPPLLHQTDSSAPEPAKASVNASTNQWICDFCNVASFSTYEEACAHEEICKRAGPSAAALMSMSRSYSMASTDEESTAVQTTPMMMVGGAPPSPHHGQYHHGFTGPLMEARRHHASMVLKMGHQQYRMMEANAAANAEKTSNKTKGKSREEQQPMTEEERRRQELHLHSLGGHIVYPNDIEMIPPYVHFLMRQVEPCLFTEADRFVARSKGPVGYPGFQCRHCHGHAGLGKYFPVSSKSLSTNSTSQNIHAHMLKCRKCPQATKDRLVQLKIEKSRAARLEPGWRKVFFDKVWERLHGKPPAEDNQQS